jgi:hypothetical protein
MKTNHLLALVSAIALTIASVLSAEAGIALFSLIGVMAIAATDYAREIKPLPVTTRSVATRPIQALRLAA